MQISDPRDRFFFPTLTLMMDSYNLTWVKATEFRSGVRENFNPNHVIIVNTFIIYYVMKYRKILFKYNAFISQP